MDRAEARARYGSEGYVILRRLIDPAVAAGWRDVLRQLFDYRGSTTGVHVMMPHEMPPKLLEACLDAPLAEAAQDVTGEPLEFLSAKPVFKSRDVTFASPWHQDTAYWRGCRKVSAWIALEPAAVDNGCLRVIPGMHRDFIEHEQFSAPQGFDNRLPEQRLPLVRVVDAVLDAGDVVYFSDHTPHASHPNLSGRDRWSLIPTWRPVGGAEVTTIWSTALRVRAPFRGDT